LSQTKFQLGFRAYQHCGIRTQSSIDIFFLFCLYRRYRSCLGRSLLFTCFTLILLVLVALSSIASPQLRSPEAGASFFALVSIRYDVEKSALAPWPPRRDNQTLRVGNRGRATCNLVTLFLTEASDATGLVQLLSERSESTKVALSFCCVSFPSLALSARLLSR
ncbi:hypothetical protein CT0861_10842, partial [Colletotrichum tofieldiae]